MTKNILLISTALLALSSCETNKQDKEAIKMQVKEDTKVVTGKAEHSFKRVANTVRDNVKKTAMQLREWYLTPLPEEVPHLVPPSYCYQVYQDVLCYRRPLEGKTHQLVGYQGNFTPTPPVAQTELLPSSKLTRDLDKATGAARVANATPVFVKPPTDVKEDKAQTIDEAAKLGSEPLPDPLLSPQL